MATLEELLDDLRTTYENRYGPNSVLECSYIGPLKSNPNFHRFKIIWVDDDNVVKEKGDIMAFSLDNNNFLWAGKNPLSLPEKITSSSSLFRDRLLDKLISLKENGKIKYFEIININEDIECARVFIKDINDLENFYIVSVDDEGNLEKQETSLKVISSSL